MLVDRVVVIHAELHHPDDAAEVGNEASQHPRFVHAAQHDFGTVARGEYLEKETIRLGIIAQIRVDALQCMGDEPRRVGMDGEPVPMRMYGQEEPEG